jgi:eukaryotic-like serine/threonine-protein kinase
VPPGAYAALTVYDRVVDGAPPASLEREIAEWLETIAVDRADTVRTTIVPEELRASTGGQRALAMLQELAGVSAAATAQLRQGDIIGQGGMGVVRLAEQVALGRTVAVKTLRGERADPRAALDLLREAWVTGIVEHPNVVPIHYVGLDDAGKPLIVMKRVEGVEWSQLMFDADAVAARFGVHDLLAWNLGIVLRVLDALRFAHSRGILHRDLKPSNVMIGEFGEVYLLDWGIAVSLRDDGSGRLPLAATQTEIAGTPCYMAPEMLGRDRGELSERTDVYLAGAVLFEVIAGRPPHDGDTAIAVITSIVASKPELPPGAPAELGRICLRAMDADASGRHASVDELRLELQAYLEHRGSERLAAGARERLDQLLRALAEQQPNREEVYRLFGAARFGFHEALVAWRGNEDARAGLVSATVAVAEHELAVGDPRAAVGLLSELEDAPAALLARARAAADDAALRHAELEKLGREHDVAIGTRTRAFLAALLGGLFTIFPLIGAFHGLALRTHAQKIQWSIAFLAITLGLGWWARESMTATAINRRVFVSGVFLFVSQTLLHLGTWKMGLSLVPTDQLMMFLWFVIVAMLCINVDWRLTPAAFGYAFAFAAALRWPDERMFLMSAANAVFTLTVLWQWRPARWRWTPEERAYHLRRRSRNR